MLQRRTASPASRGSFPSASPRSLPPSSPGYALAEALCSLVVLSLGLIPLAGLAPEGLGFLREHHALAHATRVAGELAELLSLQPKWPPPRYSGSAASRSQASRGVPHQHQWPLRP